MSFTLLASGIGVALEPVSRPFGISVAFEDTGSGGTVDIGTTASGPPQMINPKTFFGANFRSYPWLNIFNQVNADVTLAAQQFWQQYAFSFYSVLTPHTTLPSVTLNFLGPNRNIELAIDGPAVAGFYRMECWLRNSLVR